MSPVARVAEELTTPWQANNSSKSRLPKADDSTSYADIVDGTSNTALLVEIAGKRVWQNGSNTGN